MSYGPSDFRRDLASGVFDRALAARFGLTPRLTTPAGPQPAIDLVAAILVEHMGGPGDPIPRLDREDALRIAREIVGRLGAR